MLRFNLSISVLLLLVVVLSADEDKLFSGPQVGEKLPPFTVRGVYDDDAGKELDFVKQAKGKPLVLVFIHDFNRPSAMLTRLLMNYTASRAKDGLASGIVWLTDDATEAENMLKRVRHAMPKAPIGISPDGKEGPGSYGLNRNVTLTILVAKDNKVTANFALVQPSVQADLPKVLEAVVQVAGGKAPRVEELLEKEQMQPPVRKAKEPDVRLTGMLRSMIQKTAKEAAVEKTAKQIEEYVKTNEEARKELGRIAQAVVNGGKLENYGTAKAQEYLKKWAKDYGNPAERPATRKQEKP